MKGDSDPAQTSTSIPDIVAPHNHTHEPPCAPVESSSKIQVSIPEPDTECVREAEVSQMQTTTAGNPDAALIPDASSDIRTTSTTANSISKPNQAVGLRLKPKWKRRGAARAASGDTVAQIELKLVACGPLVGCFVDSAVHVATSEYQDGLLEGACYGRPAGQGERDSTGARTDSSTATGPPAGILPWASKLHDLLKEDVASDGRQPTKPGRVYQLALEEAFFLCHTLQCLDIRSLEALETGRNSRLDTSELWTAFTRCNSQFPWVYAAYCHLRSKHWVVRAGLQYGAHFVAYRHHPALVHSDFAVLVMSGGSGERVQTWSDLHAMARLASTVVKSLLLLYVTHPEGAPPPSSPSFLDYLCVEEVVVKRWLPEKHRTNESAPPQELRGKRGGKVDNMAASRREEAEGEGEEERWEGWMKCITHVWTHLSTRIWGEAVTKKEARHMERRRRWEATGGRWREAGGDGEGQVARGLGDCGRDGEEAGRSEHPRK